MPHDDMTHERCAHIGTDTQEAVQSAAYALALTVRARLKRRVADLQQDLETKDCTPVLRAFDDLVRRTPHVGINMSIASCLRMWRYGAWLNIYEATGRDAAHNDETMEEELRRRLHTDGRDYFARRHAVEQLLRFTRNTHYAALNVGGPGVARYGKCCVLFDLSRWEPHATCFAGDSLRTCYNLKGERILSDEEMLDLFAVGDDWWDATIVRHAGFLEQLGEERRGFSRSRARRQVESSNAPIELHLHGPVTVDQVCKVIMSEQDATELWDQYFAWEKGRRSDSDDIEQALDFVQLSLLLRERGIAIEHPEGS